MYVIYIVSTYRIIGAVPMKFLTKEGAEYYAEKHKYQLKEEQEFKVVEVVE